VHPMTQVVAVVPVRDGVVPAGGAEAVLDAGGRALLVGAGVDRAAAELAGVATDVRGAELGGWAPGRWARALAPELVDEIKGTEGGGPLYRVALERMGRDGWLGEPLASIGIRPAFTWHGAAIAAAIMAFPLLVRAVRVSVESVDLRIEQAARTLGAPPWRVAVRVTLPLAGAGIIGGIVLALARSFGEFGATITLAGNVAGQTQTLPLAIYSAIQTPGGEAVAMRLALISAAIATAALALSELTLRRARATMARSQHDRP